MIARWPLAVRTVLSLAFLMIGLALGAGGIWLAILGGSLYYALAGLACAVIGLLLFLRSRWSYWVVAGLHLATIVWALFEVGLDWWALVPRENLVALASVVLALPWIAGCFKPDVKSPVFQRGYILLLASVGLSVVIAVAALIASPHDTAGDLPERSTRIQDIASVAAGKDWTAYGGTWSGTRYSTLDQITAGNVDKLQVAWTFRTGDSRKEGDPVETTYEVTPLKIGNLVYLCTPRDLVFALDAETGQEKWRFDPKIRQPPFRTTQHLTCRGVSYFDGSGLPPRPDVTSDCVKRIFLPTVDGRLIALSAEKGTVCPGFGGPEGTVDLWQNMPNVTPGAYYSDSPPVIANDLIVVGGAVNDNVSRSLPSGVIRAFNVYTGKLVWNWDSKKPDQTAPIAAGETYSQNAPNSWSISSYDPKLGLIYLPIGNESPDQYGGDRGPNTEKYSAAVVALKAATGEVAWAFQTTHHDLWDMDVPAQPGLVDLTIGGQTLPALVQVTKAGEIFVLNRETGQPILPVREVPAPQGAVAGDFTAPTQPVSALSFDPAPLKETSMWGMTAFDQLSCRIKFRSLRYEGRYTPPSLQGSLTYPGAFGVFNWGGAAVDPERQVVFAMPVYLAFITTLVPRQANTERRVTREGEPAFNENFGSPYAVRIAPFLSRLGLPCQAPPWGYVAGADLTTGKISYRHVNGTVRDLSPIPLPLKMGVPGIGGPMITKGGVVFLSGTLDYYARAYDVTSGRQLWQSRLPAGGQATPMTYWSDASSRQFIIVVAGGHGSTGTKSGDSIIAYALPKQ